ncbi:uncharacterized protein F5147DRAFT_664675 [Suillus discolor]|uniref:Uncharacterized protein n=1 Tax=Suillus discolor TaxID=1912936 RepID=A0A9P7FJL9_9AGAM|nr:uncharacterized protein F5147DRAFT_664675 [Suillus discolor]KAG2119575.1 hypothetical protein F5147DRAFT_664675 [Suillus discolor]
MSSHDNEELIELHQDKHDVIPNGTALAVTVNEAAASAADREGDNNTERKISGFRDFVLSPELLKEVIDKGLDFEVPTVARAFLRRHGLGQSGHEH